MGRYSNFEVLTREALQFAMSACGVEDRALEQELLDAYLHLAPFPEVQQMLEDLDATDQRLAILSNGTREMVQALVKNAGFSQLIPLIYSVDEVKVFKPHQSVYKLAADGLRLQPSQIAFMSSNPWDAAGARAYGFRVFWVNRKRQPREYGFDSNIVEMASLAELPRLISSVNGD